MRCDYNGGECHGRYPCHRCPKCPFPVERSKYPTERKMQVMGFGRWL